MAKKTARRTKRPAKKRLTPRGVQKQKDLKRLEANIRKQAEGSCGGPCKGFGWGFDWTDGPCPGDCTGHTFSAGAIATAKRYAKLFADRDCEGGGKKCKCEDGVYTEGPTACFNHTILGKQKCQWEIEYTYEGTCKKT